jgi:hypothetical protein
MFHKIWFRAKKGFGWGWYPGTWEGWAVLGLYILCIFFVSTFFKDRPIVISSTVIVSTACLLWICYEKGEDIPYLPKKKSDKK